MYQNVMVLLMTKPLMDAVGMHSMIVLHTFVAMAAHMKKRMRKMLVVQGKVMTRTLASAAKGI